MESDLGLSGCCGAEVVNEGYVMMSELSYGTCSKCGLSGIYSPKSEEE